MNQNSTSEMETAAVEASSIPTDPMAVTWTEKYSKTIEKYWNTLPNFLGSFIASMAVFILGSTIRGKINCLRHAYIAGAAEHTWLKLVAVSEIGYERLPPVN